jgi:hypothetical protein
MQPNYLLHVRYLANMHQLNEPMEHEMLVMLGALKCRARAGHKHQREVLVAKIRGVTNALTFNVVFVRNLVHILKISILIFPSTWQKP